IAASGVLNLADQTYTWSNLTVDGSILLSANAGLTTPQLTIDPGGVVGGSGALNGPILDNGKIVVGPPPNSSVLVITGPVSGSGTLEIDSSITQERIVGPVVHSATLELQGATSTNVTFNNVPGILMLDNPASFSGQIAPNGSGDQILLR